MLNENQLAEIRNYLLTKKLPIDLVLEIKDHMIEQIENSTEQSFQNAFENTKNDWRNELRMIYSVYSPFKKHTVFQQKVTNKANKTILLKTLSYFLPFFLLSLAICSFSKEFSKILFFSVFGFVGIISLFSAIYFYKIQNTTMVWRKKKNISIYQNNTQLFFTGGFYVVIFNLFNFEERFNKFYFSVEAVFGLHYQNISYLAILYTYIFLFFWLFGLFYFLEYKKTIETLKKRINLNL